MLTYGSATCTHTAHGALLTKLPGGPGRLPSQGSHGSGRAELPHPARRGDRKNDVFDLDQCEPVDKGQCMDICVAQQFEAPNCEHFASDSIVSSREARGSAGECGVERARSGGARDGCRWRYGEFAGGGRAVGPRQQRS